MRTPADDKFVALLKLNSVLWDPNHKDYKTTVVREKSWKHLSDKMGMSGKVAMSIWSGNFSFKNNSSFQCWNADPSTRRWGRSIETKCWKSQERVERDMMRIWSNNSISWRYHSRISRMFPITLVWVSGGIHCFRLAQIHVDRLQVPFELLPVFSFLLIPLWIHCFSILTKCQIPPWRLRIFPVIWQLCELWNQQQMALLTMFKGVTTWRFSPLAHCDPIIPATTTGATGMWRSTLDSHRCRRPITISGTSSTTHRDLSWLWTRSWNFCRRNWGTNWKRTSSSWFPMKCPSCSNSWFSTQGTSLGIILPCTRTTFRSFLSIKLKKIN